MITRVEAKKTTDVDSWFWFFIRVLIEKGLYYHYTYETEKAKPIFMKAIQCMYRQSRSFIVSQLECELTGVQGRRTKYQTFDTSQLFVFAQSHLKEDVATTEYDKANMNIIKLDEIDKDNILLENIMIKADTDEKLKQQTPLSVIDQVWIWRICVIQILMQCICLDIKNNNPKFGLITEEIATYINRIMVGLRNGFECRHIL